MIQVEEAKSKVWHIARDMFGLNLIDRFFIIGSWAKGTQTPESDVDIAVIYRAEKLMNMERYLLSKCALDGIFGMSQEDIVDRLRNLVYPTYMFTYASTWFFLPKERIHGLLYIDIEDIDKPYIEITRRGKAILTEK